MKLTLVTRKRTGEVVDAEVLRPRSWVEENGLAVGVRVRFLSEELELEGVATLTALAPCPPVATGDGEVVTGRFVTRRVNQIVRMVFTNGTVLEGTAVHPIWSPELNNWVPMGDFKPGDFVLARSGWLQIAETQLQPRCTAVYNLEINAEHVYEVTDDAILVHNAYPAGAPSGLPTPNVSDSKLKNIVRDLFKGTKTPNPIGTGSTADALRNELLTGQPTYGVDHSQKAKEYVNALTKWLKKNPSASHPDRLVAQSLLNDLIEAIAGR